MTPWREERSVTGTRPERYMYVFHMPTRRELVCIYIGKGKGERWTERRKAFIHLYGCQIRNTDTDTDTEGRTRRRKVEKGRSESEKFHYMCVRE